MEPGHPERVLGPLDVGAPVGLRLLVRPAARVVVTRRPVRHRAGVGLLPPGPGARGRPAGAAPPGAGRAMARAAGAVPYRSGGHRRVGGLGDRRLGTAGGDLAVQLDRHHPLPSWHRPGRARLPPAPWPAGGGAAPEPDPFCSSRLAGQRHRACQQPGHGAVDRGSRPRGLGRPALGRRVRRVPPLSSGRRPWSAGSQRALPDDRQPRLRPRDRASVVVVGRRLWGHLDLFAGAGVAGRGPRGARRCPPPFDAVHGGLPAGGWFRLRLDGGGLEPLRVRAGPAVRARSRRCPSRPGPVGGGGVGKPGAATLGRRSGRRGDHLHRDGLDGDVDGRLGS